MVSGQKRPFPSAAILSTDHSPLTTVMRILVTGATGFIGSHVARALVDRGDIVRVLRRPTSPSELLQGLAIEHAIGDILEPPSLSAACAGIEAVVHCAARMGRGGGPAARLQSHVDGTRNMLAAALGAGVRRFVYTSSVAALGVPDHAPAPTDKGIQLLDETHEWHGPPSLWAYGHAKHQAEQLVRLAAQQGMEGLILNPALVIGPGDRNRVSNGLIWHMLRGRVPPLVPGGLNVVDIRDVTDGYLAAIDRGRSGERYLLCGENRTLSDLIGSTARIVGRRPPRLRLSLRATRTVGALAAGLGQMLRLPISPDLLRMAGIYFYYDGGKARRELGLGSPRAFAPAAMASAEWYRRRTTGTHLARPL